jgi:ABC-type uncharacterized transport system ATPase subunit
MTNKETKCLNNCSQKWENLLIAYCQERQIIHLFNQEQEKDEKAKELTEILEHIRKHDQK